MKIVLPIVGCCVVAQYWVPGMAGVGGVVFLIWVYVELDRFQRERKKERLLRELGRIKNKIKVCLYLTEDPPSDHP